MSFLHYAPWFTLCVAVLMVTVAVLRYRRRRASSDPWQYRMSILLGASFIVGNLLQVTGAPRNVRLMLDPVSIALAVLALVCAVIALNRRSKPDQRDS